MRTSAAPIALCAILFICCLQASATVMITEICPDTWLKGEADEFFVITGGSLDRVIITDGEGSVRFPAGVRATKPLTCASRGEAYRTVHGVFPDYEWYDSSPAVPDLIRTGQFALGNSGDAVTVLVGGVEVQSVGWPDDVTCREGQVHVLEDGVWDRRPYFIGQSRFSPATYTGATVTAFASPDCSREVLAETLSSAGTSLLINVYEFTDAGIARYAADAAANGATVRVLLEGGPVGGIPDGQDGIARMLTGTGADVRIMTTTDDAHARYRFDHAKYVVADDDTVLVTTENFGASGFPEPGTAGNRGWGVVITHPGVAEYFTMVFEEDAAGGDIIRYTGSAEEPEEPRGTPRTAAFSPQTFAGATVTPVLAPDTADLIPAMIEEARVSVDIQQAYISDWAGGQENPYLAAAVRAAERGVRVRVILDSYWFNIEGEHDNDEMVASINARAAQDGLPMGARLARTAESDIVKVHTKGVIVDGETVLVSSVNWNEHSPSFNREAGVIIRHPGAGAYFTAVFEADWEDAGSATPPAAAAFANNDRLLRILAAAGMAALLAVYYAWRQRR
ncbi:MAG TPA: phospholipase [Methanoculleus sp.]|nr:phospholipase [Methanoculleus sp.]